MSDEALDFGLSPEMWMTADSWKQSHATRPLHAFILKIASRCNIDCDYCYMYHGADQSWRTRPKFMSARTVEQIANRIADHVRRHCLDDVEVTFHGGEPLLAGAERLESYATILRSIIPCRISWGVQTNGTQFTDDILGVLIKWDVKIGISIDGNRTANDRHRLHPGGRSSYDAVRRGIAKLQVHPRAASLLGGFLAVIDLANEPRQVLLTMLEIGASSIDLLLPDCHHDSPPSRPDGPHGERAYGKWLSQFFDEWYAQHPLLEVRLLDEIIALLLGGKSTMEAIAAGSVDLVILETDGDIEAVDTLKVVGRSATSLGMNVSTHSFDDALMHPAILSRMVGFESLCELCRSCPELEHCGGGYIPHRYSRARGFLNPSVYCEDLKYLFDHIRVRIDRDLAASRLLKGRNVI